VKVKSHDLRREIEARYWIGEVSVKVKSHDLRREIEATDAD
jgi:hypothetical protein